jgi:hypothetical protein
VQALVERVLNDERLELAHDPSMSGEVELEVDPLNDNHEAKLVETPRFDLCERLECKLGEGCSPPERESPAIFLQSVGGTLIPLSPCCLNQKIELVKIELSRRYVQLVARRACHENLAPEELSQLRDVDGHDLARTRGRLARPELVDETIGRDNRVCVQEQEGEQRTVLRSLDRQGPIAEANLERAEEEELES